MAKKKKDNYLDPREKLLNTLKLKDLKRAAIVRGMPFREVIGSSVPELQSWVFRNYSNKISPNALDEFDKWYEADLFDQDIITGALHVDLKFGYYTYDDDGNRRAKKRNYAIVGFNKTDEEKAAFKPKKGSKKELAFSLFGQGLSTIEVIEAVVDAYPDVSEGSIKVWGSQFRKREKVRLTLDHEK